MSNNTDLAVDTAVGVTDQLRFVEGATYNTSQHSGAFPADNLLMSRDMMNVIETVFQVGILPVLILCGLSFNIINMAVFLRQGLSDRINLCLFSLAVCDTGYMTFVMTRRMDKILHLISDSIGDYWKLRSLPLLSVYVGFLNTSNCLTLLISLERCICVVWPLKVKTILSQRKLACLILLAAAFCFATTVPFVFYFDVHGYQDPATNLTSYRLVPTAFYWSHSHNFDVVFDNVNMLVPTVSLIGVTVNTVIISVHLRSVLTWRQNAASVNMTAPSSKERREASVTRMLVVVCIIYGVCTLPFVIHAFMRFTVPGFSVEGRYGNTVHATMTLVHTLLCVNSSANFVVYYNMGTRFKESLHDMLRKRTVENDAEK